MARFDDAQVGDKVKVPMMEGVIIRVDKSDSYPLKVDFGEYGSDIFKIEGNMCGYSEAPALFYTNDAGDLLTERPKRKVRKEIPVSAVRGMDGNWVAVTGMDRIKNNATLIMEVEE